MKPIYNQYGAEIQEEPISSNMDAFETALRTTIKNLSEYNQRELQAAIFQTVSYVFSETILINAMKMKKAQKENIIVSPEKSQTISQSEKV